MSAITSYSSFTALRPALVTTGQQGSVMANKGVYGTHPSSFKLKKSCRVKRRDAIVYGVADIIGGPHALILEVYLN